MPECPRDSSELVKLVDGLAVIYVCADDSGVWGPSGKRDGADFGFHPHGAGLIPQIAR